MPLIFPRTVNQRAITCAYIEILYNARQQYKPHMHKANPVRYTKYLAKKQYWNIKNSTHLITEKRYALRNDPNHTNGYTIVKAWVNDARKPERVEERIYFPSNKRCWWINHRGNKWYKISRADLNQFISDGRLVELKREYQCT